VYEVFFGLSERPFSTLPDPTFMYWSEDHQLALSMLQFGIMRRAPMTLLTGEAGCGKTALLRHLLGDLPGDLDSAYVVRAAAGPLLDWVMLALREPSPPGEGQVQTYARFLNKLDQIRAAGRRLLLVIDEAQTLSTEEVEEVRMLSELPLQGEGQPQILLAGQPLLRETIRRPELASVLQRVTSDFHLSALSSYETGHYIQRRLMIAGAVGEVFTARCCELIYEATGGVPRLINTLCDLCLTHAFADERRGVDEGLLREVLNSAWQRGIFGQFAELSGVPRLVVRSY